MIEIAIRSALSASAALTWLFTVTSQPGRTSSPLSPSFASLACVRLSPCTDCGYLLRSHPASLVSACGSFHTQAEYSRSSCLSPRVDPFTTSFPSTIASSMARTAYPGVARMGI
ncbi:hypothetical protein LXA43DRAFT_1019557 [Ganoderma leucocontextum]|nr:hypothetical protein LXA43DRAFT_1019557 [Ganoderma leucocontextum]